MLKKQIKLFICIYIYMNSINYYKKYIKYKNKYLAIKNQILEEF